MPRPRSATQRMPQNPQRTYSTTASDQKTNTIFEEFEAEQRSQREKIKPNK